MEKYYFSIIKRNRGFDVAVVSQEQLETKKVSADSGGDIVRKKMFENGFLESLSSVYRPRIKIVNRKRLVGLCQSMGMIMNEEINELI